MEIARPRVLAEIEVNYPLLMRIIGVSGFAALTALLAQVRIPLPFSPVPITGQTLAVLLSGAILGAGLGATSQGVYLAAGVVGIPVFAGGASGLSTVLGPTSGYLIGFIVASAFVGLIARRRRRASVGLAITAFGVGTLLIYVLGVVGLILTLSLTVNEALMVGVVPFILGDVLKAAIAGIVMTGAWSRIERFRKVSDITW